MMVKYAAFIVQATGGEQTQDRCIFRLCSSTLPLSHFDYSEYRGTLSVQSFCPDGLYYKCSKIIIYDHSDSGMYYNMLRL
jgi:hypothetical protein